MFLWLIYYNLVLKTLFFYLLSISSEMLLKIYDWSYTLKQIWLCKKKRMYYALKGIKKVKLQKKN